MTWHAILLSANQWCHSHSESVEDLLSVGYQEYYSLVGSMPCSGFFVFALSASFKSSAITKSHIHHACFLKMLLGVKRQLVLNTHCLLRETGQLPLYFFWFRWGARLWNSLLTTNDALLSKINEADLRLALKRK